MIGKTAMVMAMALAGVAATEPRPEISSLSVRADGLARAIQAFGAGGRKMSCYHAVLIRQGSTTGVAFIPDQPPPRANGDGTTTTAVYIGGVPGCGRSVGYLIDEKGDIAPAQMGRD
jgi:hypothetical protein